MALTKHLTVTNPLSNSSILTPTITCRRCLSNFSSKSELFEHVRARPRCSRIKSTVSLISPRAYPQHGSQHGSQHASQHGVSTLSASTSSGYSGGTYYQAASSTNYTSDSDDEYEQELGLKCELEYDHEQEQEVEQHVNWPQVDYNQHEELTHEEEHVDWPQVDHSLEQDHACVKEGYNQGYDCGYDHGYDYSCKQDSYGDHDYEQDDYDYEPDDCEDNGYYSD